MGSFICKQPNGLYCRFSSVVDCPTHWNMTEEDYINLTLENYLRPFDWVKKYFRPMNMTQEEFDKFLEETSKEIPDTSEGYRKVPCLEPLILERDEFSDSTWNIYKYLFGIKPSNPVSRIKVNISSIEYM